MLVHQDSSIFFVKDNGNFISHLQSNLKDIGALRNFTCNTIPFVVHSLDNHDVTYNPQELLASAFMILKQPYVNQSNSQANKSASPIERELDDIQKSSLMAGEADKIVKEMNVADLGHFTAYSN